MKRFVYMIFIFIIPLLILYVFVEYSLRNIDSVYEQKRNSLIAQSDSIEILIVGSSDADCGINPAYFKRPAFNLANISQTILYDKQLLLKYIPILKNLKYVVFSIGYQALHRRDINNRDFFYYYYYDINIRNKNYFKEYLSFSQYVYSPKIAVQLLFNKNKIKYVKGWVGIDSTDYANLTKKRAQGRVTGFNCEIKRSIQMKDYVYIYSEFESLISFLKQKEIIPILVTVPCHKYFTDNADCNILKSNLQYINKIKEKYNLVYLNSLKDTSFKDNHFLNHSHLNTFGAAKFTAQIDSIINSICKIKK